VLREKKVKFIKMTPHPLYKKGWIPAAAGMTSKEKADWGHQSAFINLAITYSHP
jgi:hypothetical protein